MAYQVKIGSTKNWRAGAGRYWMLGADSGKWYYYDGARWIQGEPYAGATPPPLNTPVESRPATTNAFLVPLTVVTELLPLLSPTTAPSRGLPIVPIIIVLVLMALAVAAFLVSKTVTAFLSPASAQITPILPPTITRADPTAGARAFPPTPPLPAPLATALPTDIPPTVAPAQPAPTVELATAAPAVTIVVVTAEPTATVPCRPSYPRRPPPTALPTAVPTQPPATAAGATDQHCHPNFPPSIVCHQNPPQTHPNAIKTSPLQQRS